MKIASILSAGLKGLMVLLVLASVGGTYYIYTLREKDKKDFDNIRTSLTGQIQELQKNSAQSSKSEVEVLAKSMKKTEEDIKTSTERFKTEIGRVAEMDARVSKAQQEIQTLKQSSSTLQQEIREFRTASNIVASSLKELEGRYNSMSDRLATQLPLDNQGNYALLKKKRFESLPNERRVILSAVNGLPLQASELKKVTAQVEGADLTTVKKITDLYSNLIIEGKDAHIIIGKATPIERLVWIEVYGETTFDIIHPSLDGNLWSKIDNRDNLPSLFKNGEFGIYYNKNKELTVYQLVD